MLDFSGGLPGFSLEMGLLAEQQMEENIENKAYGTWHMQGAKNCNPCVKACFVAARPTDA